MENVAYGIVQDYLSKAITQIDCSESGLTFNALFISLPYEDIPLTHKENYKGIEGDFLISMYMFSNESSINYLLFKPTFETFEFDTIGVLDDKVLRIMLLGKDKASLVVPFPKGFNLIITDNL